MNLPRAGSSFLRGLPVREFSDQESATLYWAIGKLLGRGTTQNAAAEFLCSVTDRGVKFGYPGAQMSRMLEAIRVARI